jgi:hypothetical protein
VVREELAHYLERAMSNMVVTLEDDVDRLMQMRKYLAEVLPGVEQVYFDNAFLMIHWLKDHLPQVVLISLDHDLPINGDHGTGRDVVDYLAGLPPTCPVIVHTSNEHFAPGMMRVLNDAKWPSARVYPHSDHNWVGREWAEQIGQLVATGWIFA